MGQKVASRSAQIEADLKAKGLQSRIHRRAAHNRPLSQRQKWANTTRSKVRARVEHVFGQQQCSRELTSARALQPLAQLRQKSPKAGIVRGALMLVSLSKHFIFIANLRFKLFEQRFSWLFDVINIKRHAIRLGRG